MPEPRPQNLLFILSDEHHPRVLGSAGHLVRTPNLDALAARGTRFTSAYCNSPICVPSRASLATGRYVHQVGCWDNANPYTGTPESWHAALGRQGVDVGLVGKLHYRGGDDYGFSDELLALHVVDGKGDLKALFREELPPKAGNADMARMAGRGSSSYSEYDTRIAARASEWLRARAASGDARPFVLCVHFVMPHFPLIAPEECYDLYEAIPLDDLRAGLEAPPADHPTLNRMRGFMDYDRYFDDARRATALRAYFGMVSRIDQLVGDLLHVLEETGQAGATRVLYSSDHGDNLGNRGMWGKSVMYDDACGVPMILAGADVPEGAVVDTPVSLVDVAPTAAQGTGCAAEGHWVGRSLIELAQGVDTNRAVFAEYHAAGAETGMFMLRKGKWKLVYYVGQRAQLFDLEADPGERADMGADPAHAEVRVMLEAELRAICDPEEVSARAFADQAQVIAANGGREGIQGSADIPFTPAPV